MSKYNIALEDQLIILDALTVTKLLEQNPDSLVLYLFYHKKAKEHETNQPWVTDTYVMGGLSWGKTRFYRAKKVLTGGEHPLVTIVQENIKRFGKTFIKLNYIRKTPLASFPDSGLNGDRSAGDKCLKNKKKVLKEQEESALSPLAQNQPEKKKIPATTIAGVSKLDDELLGLIDLWNGKDEERTFVVTSRKKNPSVKIGKTMFSPCRGITVDLRKEYRKKRKSYSLDDIKHSFMQYGKDIVERKDDLDGGDYHKHRFSLYTFLKQGNGFVKYVNNNN